jgi:hypothetical protein
MYCGKPRLHLTTIFGVRDRLSTATFKHAYGFTGDVVVSEELNAQLVRLEENLFR